jgi:hypothetical protein
MRHYCTYFDGHYLTRGLALHQSLVRHAGEFELFILCMDESVEAQLRNKALPHVRLLPLAELVANCPVLTAARADRSKLEFYFTCTSWLMRHLLPQVPAGELLTYLDADLYFFASPQSVYEEIGAASVAITPHRFPASLAHLERYGRYNVGWVSLRHDATGQACAADWADRCAAWCFNRLEDDRYADQKYLDTWAERFPGTVSLKHPGVNAAPWNVKDAAFADSPSGPTVNGRPLIFYHFHALTHLGRQLHDPSLHKYDAVMTPGLREHVYLTYLRQLLTHEAAPGPDQPDVLPPIRIDDPRAGLAVPHLLARLQASELDRAQRLSSIEENIAATKQTIAYLKIVEQDRDQARADQAQTVAYLRTVEQDSAERLASIQFHQEKLKQAYADHAHNVAYIERLHTEIAAHVKVAEEHGRIIADLNDKLRAALERR